MNKYLDRLVSIFFTERCPYCNCVIESGKTACEICLTLFPEKYFTNYAKGGYPCFSPFLYQGIFATAIRRFKFNRKKAYSAKLAVPLADAVLSQNGGEKYDTVTFVPMHPKKQRVRGFNQSELLARDTAELLGIPCETLLIKHKDNNEQHKCASVAERKKNVQGAYKEFDKEMIEGKSILLIDDILTTGYTLGECCSVLRKSGAKTIHCATVCAKNSV